MQAAKRLAGQVDMWMTDEQFDAIAQLVESKTGILLPPSKRPLVVGRMQNIVRRSGMHTFQDWFKRYMRIPNARTVSSIVDAMTTNHTYFWREAEHFERLRDEVVPAIAAKRKRRKDLRVWCGAASRGQEPYTIQMMLREALGDAYPRWSAGLLATDIDSKALQICRAGRYVDEDVERLPLTLRKKYFQKVGPEDWEVVQDLKRDALFRRLNLMAHLPFKQPLDVVFLRNVLIYFDNPTKEAVLARVHAALEPGGWLFVGMSESLQVLQTKFETIGPGAYRRKA